MSAVSEWCRRSKCVSLCSSLDPVIAKVLDRNSDVSARLNAIEGLLAQIVSTFPQSATLQASLVPDDRLSHDVSSLTASGEEIFHPRSSDLARQMMSGKPPPSGLFSVAKPARRSGFGWGLTEGRMISLTEEDSPELSEVLQTLKESGISKGHLEWIIAGVPGRGMADGLVELYFR